MLALVIVLGWLFLVALACNIGTNKELAEEAKQKEAWRAQADGLEQQVFNLNHDIVHKDRDIMLLQNALEELLEAYKDSQKIQAFDKMLGALPKTRTLAGMRSWFEVYERSEPQGRRRVAREYAKDPGEKEVRITKLDFAAQIIETPSGRWIGWERAGWTITPSEAFKVEEEPRRRSRNYPH